MSWVKLLWTSSMPLCSLLTPTLSKHMSVLITTDSKVLPRLVLNKLCLSMEVLAASSDPWLASSMQVHCFVVAFFVVGEVFYIFTASGVLNSSRGAFPQSVQGGRDTMVNSPNLTIVLGVITLGAKVLRIDIDPYSAYIEWILFNLSFYIFHVLGQIMPYNAVVVPQWKQI